MNRFFRALRAKCGECWGHGGYTYQGHWTRCSACGGSGQS